MTQTPYEVFKRHFTLGAIESAFEDHISGSLSAGVDGLTATTFREQAEEQLRIVYRKANDGTYSFSPYRQVLVPRGHDRKPRRLAVPTIRDRVVLYLLKEVLQKVFQDKVRSELPNQYVEDIQSNIKSLDNDGYTWIKADIKNFYPSIDRDLLFELLQARTTSSYLLTLISRALLAPIVPENHSRQRRHTRVVEQGVPQGLAISNILAEIYGSEVDSALRTKCHLYRRYVDDILMIVKDERVKEVTEAFVEKLKEMKLQENWKKRDRGTLGEEFQYLGYVFRDGEVTVRDSTIERHIERMAGIITKYRRGGYGHISDPDTRKSVFIQDLNERITGAISEDKRYGWIFYFLAITDKEVLHRIDAVVQSIVGRTELGSEERDKIKRTVRAYYEAENAPLSGYIRNYNSFSFREKREFLMNRGIIDGQASAEEVKRKFERESKRRTRQLKLDLGTFS